MENKENNAGMASGSVNCAQFYTAPAPKAKPLPPQHPSRIALVTAVFAVCFAVLFYRSIFCGVPLGANVPAGTVLICAALLCALPKGHASALSILPFVLAFSASFALYSNILLLTLNAICLVICGTLMFLRFCGKDTRLEDILTAIIIRPFSRIGMLFRHVFSRKRGKAAPVVLGVVIAIPVLIVLMILLCGSDMVFGKLIGQTFGDLKIWDIIGYVFFGALAFTLVGSLLFSLGSPEPNAPANDKEHRRPFNASAVLVLISLVAAVLIVFSAIQIIYLVGSSTLPYGISYSEYARSGFFQLCGACALVFTLIALTAAFTQDNDKKKTLALKILQTLLCASNVLMLISAFKRMAMYEQAFGYTLLRIYVQAFMIMLCLLTAAALLKIWLKKLPVLRISAAVCAVCLIGLTYFNADAFVARSNTGRSDTNIDYLLTLSADALPEYADLLQLSMFVRPDTAAADDERTWELDSQIQTRQLNLLRIADSMSDEWISANAGRTRAKNSLDKISDIVAYCHREADDYYYTPWF